MVLIPVTKVLPTYRQDRKQLTILAEGRVPTNCYGYDLIREPIRGILLFRLVGHFGGQEPSKILKGYIFTKSFHIVDIHPGQPVIVISENHPLGKAYPVIWLRLGANPSDAISDPVPETASSIVTAATLPKVIPDPEPIVVEVPVGASFNVNGSVPPPPGSLINQFDPFGFAIESANIEYGSLVWRLRALEAGVFIITIRSSLPGTIDPVEYTIREKVYLVTVAPEFKTQEYVSDVAEAVDEGLEIDDPIRPFDDWLGFLKQAHNTVKNTIDRNAKFVRVNATHDLPFPPTDPAALRNLLAIFKVKNGYAHIRSTKQGRWGKPQVISELRPLELPYDLDGIMDIFEAHRRISRNGYPGPLEEVALFKRSNFFGKGKERPLSYYFYLANYPRDVIVVDAKSGNFIREPRILPVSETKVAENGITDEVTSNKVTNGDTNGDTNGQTKEVPPPPVSVAA